MEMKILGSRVVKENIEIEVCPTTMIQSIRTEWRKLVNPGTEHLIFKDNQWWALESGPNGPKDFNEVVVRKATEAEILVQEALDVMLQLFKERKKKLKKDEVCV